jgi:ATP-binding cassette subfamily B protein
MSRVHDRATRVQEGFAQLTTTARESLEGMRVVKSFAREEGQRAVFETVSADYAERNLSLGRIQRLFFPSMSLFGGLAAVIVLWRGGMLVMNREISLGTFVAFTGYLALLLWPMAALGWTVNLFQRGRASWDRLLEVLNAEEEPLTAGGRVPEGTGDLRFTGVTFARGDREILRGIDLHIPSGERVALVGPTGAGKTTLLRLLARLEQPAAGSIVLDGAPLPEWDLRELRGALAFVPQDPFLFSESIAHNVEIGRDAVDRAEVLRAATAAGLREEIEAFTDGWETVVGERGVTLSGGQRQRATLARALVRSARVLVLDDAFASMDAKTEEAILDEIAPAMRSRTTFLVSHRLSTIRRADRIVYLEQGRILEQGTHEELVERGGRYAAFIRRQRLFEKLAGPPLADPSLADAEDAA